MLGEWGAEWVRYHPAQRERLAALGLRNATHILEMAGPVVSGHPDRHVRRVELAGQIAYLKVEHRIPWRDRLRHWLIGGGFVSKSEREANVLAELEVLKLIPVAKPELIETSCCGMAGSFGYDARHYSVSMQMAELSLLPAVRKNPGAIVVADGTSCRHQIAHGAGRPARHVAVLLDELS